MTVDTEEAVPAPYNDIVFIRRDGVIIKLKRFLERAGWLFINEEVDYTVVFTWEDENG
jgi:histidinol phosphatase-like enzyme